MHVLGLGGDLQGQPIELELGKDGILPVELPGMQRERIVVAAVARRSTRAKAARSPARHTTSILELGACSPSG